MPFNGSGTFNRVYNWVNDKLLGYKISSSRMDTEFDGIATGLSQCITKTGETQLTANIPFNNYKITGLGVGSSRTDSLNIGQVQDNQFNFLGLSSGSADAYTLAPSPAISSYQSTQRFTCLIHTSNLTTTPYLQVSGIANPSTNAVIKKLNGNGSEISLAPKELVANQLYTFQRNLTNTAWLVLELGTLNTPAFQAIKPSNQTITLGVITKLTFTTELLDTHSYFDNATDHRFTPLIAGWYFINAGAKFIDGGVAPQAGVVFVYKNGALLSQNNIPFFDNGDCSIPISALVNFNGSTDYIEIFCLTGGTGATTIGGSATDYSTYFSGFKLNI